MATTITDGVTPLSVIVLTGYEAERDGRNIIHTIIGAPEPSVTLRQAGLRKGALEALVASVADAMALDALLAQALVCSVSDDDVDAIDMDFVVPDGGSITVSLDDDTRARWLVKWDFQEVIP